MDGFPLQDSGPGGVPGLGGATIDGVDSAASSRQEVVIHLGVGGKGRGGV